MKLSELFKEEIVAHEGIVVSISHIWADSVTNPQYPSRVRGMRVRFASGDEIVLGLFYSLDELFKVRIGEGYKITVSNERGIIGLEHL